MTSLYPLRDARPLGRGAIVLMRGAIDLHAGIYFRRSNQMENVLHLASHYRLLCEETGDEWAFADPAIDPIELEVLAGFCALLDRVRPRVPYGLSFRTSRFDDEGRFVPGEGQIGLTCSTFVLAVFDWARIPLVVRESWETRAEDILAQQQLLALLSGRAVADHLQALAREVGCMRFRTEEIAAASMNPMRPVPFATAVRDSVPVRAAFERSMYAVTSD